MAALEEVEPTAGIEPANLFLTKEALYRLSYVGSNGRKCRPICLCTYESRIRAEGGAGDEIRTRDIQLGRLELYQLSYTRMHTQQPPRPNQCSALDPIIPTR